ncbi:hypothetical protein B6D12_06215 [Gilliamella apicola]|uniref:tail fiber assembly protein n=2 Tax=Gilliamella apicola TaxID=1196095 RepID=UPI000A33DF0A|nr:tail fiber assembly protein [Gilliamella apicola]OTP90473.1 hypothetical protein B5S41_03555 [Gilliamella apicola]OTP93742.1 hypothetical protein B6D13_09030 [Gilliamella apicola]OTQ00709.1 hypothetical protein B6D07_09730 [Gilliamella apicola]OTQ05755.1 hypothetical protein B6D12_06215 [Gilliamella apicola]
MINYYFDNTNELNPYTYQMYAHDGTLPPDNALRIEPEFRDGFHPCAKNGEWILVDDHRGTTVYNIETKEAVKINELGAIKPGFTLLKPFDFCKWNGTEWILNVDEQNAFKIKQNESRRDFLLNDTNTEIDILNRAVRLGRATEANKKRLELLENYSIDLYQLDLSDPDVVIPKKP